MGQGHYTALVYGIKGDPCELIYIGDDAYRDIAPWASGYVKTSYESRTQWAGVFVGASDDVVSSRLGRCVDLEYEAYSVKDIEQSFADEIQVAKSQWETFRQFAKDNGVDLPEGELMLVFDYD